MQTDFENMNMYAVSSSHSATFLMQSIEMFTQMMFSNSLGDQGTCLSFGQQSRILIRFFGHQLPSNTLILLHDPVELLIDSS